MSASLVGSEMCIRDSLRPLRAISLQTHRARDGSPKGSRAPASLASTVARSRSARQAALPSRRDQRSACFARMLAH
eukprot:10738693-Alexandrium_andersonii.AAC.1